MSNCPHMCDVLQILFLTKIEGNFYTLHRNASLNVWWGGNKAVVKTVKKDYFVNLFRLRVLSLDEVYYVNGFAIHDSIYDRTSWICYSRSLLR